MVNFVIIKYTHLLNSVFQSIVMPKKKRIFGERLSDKIKDICLWKIQKAFLITN